MIFRVQQKFRKTPKSCGPWSGERRSARVRAVLAGEQEADRSTRPLLGRRARGPGWALPTTKRTASGRPGPVAQAAARTGPIHMVRHESARVVGQEHADPLEGFHSSKPWLEISKRHRVRTIASRLKNASKGRQIRVKRPCIRPRPVERAAASRVLSQGNVRGA